MPSLFPLDILDGILDLIESVSLGFPTYSFIGSQASFYENSSFSKKCETEWIVSQALKVFRKYVSECIASQLSRKES